MLYKILEELIYPSVLTGFFPKIIELDYLLYKDLCIELEVDEIEDFLDMKIEIKKGAFNVR